MAMEYERRFLLKNVPDGIPADAWQTIRQGYLAVDRTGEVRIREQGGQFTLTAKKGEGSAREEVELPLSAAQFESLWPLVRDRCLHKRRAEVAWSSATLVIDEYLLPVPFLLAEIEFASEADMQSLPLPDFLGPDVTPIATMHTFPLLIERVKQWQNTGE